MQILAGGTHISHAPLHQRQRQRQRKCAVKSLFHSERTPNELEAPGFLNWQRKMKMIVHRDARRFAVYPSRIRNNHRQLNNRAASRVKRGVNNGVFQFAITLQQDLFWVGKRKERERTSHFTM